MHRFCTLFLLLLAGACSSRPSPYTVIESTRVVDVQAGRIRPQTTVVLKDSLIYWVGPASQAGDFAGARHIDGRGRYLIPGLWNMHTHVCWASGNDSLLFPLLLSYGITGLRDMGGDLAVQRAFKTRVTADPTAGPELYGAGPIFDGDPPVMYDFTVPLGADTDVAAALDSAVGQGADFIKTYSLLREPQLRQVAAYARAHALPFAGHLSEYVAPETALALGQKSVEHLNRLEDIWMRDPARIDTLAKRMRQQEAWLCPTLLIYHRKAHWADTATLLENFDPFIHPLLQQEWQAYRARRMAEARDSATLQERWTGQRALVGHLHQQGVKLLAGSDFAGMPYVYPGLGLHQELALLQEAGLSPAEALATATLHPAEFLGLAHRYGSVSEGKMADLVLLEANPLENIQHTRSVWRVFREGREVQGLLPIHYSPQEAWQE